MNEQIEIRDTRNGEWLWVYNSVIADPHLSLADKAVYAAIASFGGFQKISPTVEELGNRCKVSERQVRDSLANLIDKDYLKTEKGIGRGNANVYWLLKRPKGCRLCTFSVKGALSSVKGADNAPPTIYKDKKDSNEIRKPNPDIPDLPDTAIKDTGELALADWLFELWNKCPMAESVGVKNPPNTYAKAQLLKPCRKLTGDIVSAINAYKKRPREELERAIRDYVSEILNRSPKNDYARHRFSFYEFFSQPKGIKKFLNL